MESSTPPLPGSPTPSAEPPLRANARPGFFARTKLSSECRDANRRIVGGPLTGFKGRISKKGRIIFKKKSLAYMLGMMACWCRMTGGGMKGRSSFDTSKKKISDGAGQLYFLTNSPNYDTAAVDGNKTINPF